MNPNSQTKLHHLPFNDMQSYDIENDTKNITFIDEIIFYPPLSIKNTILNVN